MFEEYSDEYEKGKLKVFFGYAAGVGKTYSMLQAAHRDKDQGKDVVVGYIERHTRPDTLALLSGLESIPNKRVDYRGIELSELDLDGVLKRKPEVVLVDELAHTNAPGSRHRKRYQDIEEILRHGIDVYTTVNVQHLESLNDLVESITKIAVSERVPDYVFDRADNVSLVDIEPDELLARLKTGKVYGKAQAERAINHFFTKDNLVALREIALRRTADRLSRRSAESGNETVSRAGEHILVCLSGSKTNAKVIRTAARMAEAFHSSFTGIYVDEDEFSNSAIDENEDFQKNIRLAEQLGAQIVTVYGEDAAEKIASYAKLKGITKIVLGRTGKRGIFRRKSLADKINDLSGDIDVYIIPDTSVTGKYDFRKGIRKASKAAVEPTDILKTLSVIIVSCLICFIFDQLNLSEANIIIVYILGVLITAIITRGYACGLVASLVNVTLFNLFFTEPRYTLTAYDPSYPITFLCMTISSILASTLANKVKNEATLSAQKAYYLEILMNSSKKFSEGRDQEDIIQIAAVQIASILSRPVAYSLYYPEEELDFKVYPSEHQEIVLQMDSHEMAVATWVTKNNKHAGATTDTLSDADNLYLSVRSSQGVMGVVAIPIKNYDELDNEEKNLTISLLDECGVVLSRRRLSEERKAIEMETQRERLRANLLRAISHDLRTPLTSISGNAVMLMDNGDKFSEEKKKEIYNSIYDDAMWLVELTENLLSITRIENGTINLHMTSELMEDVFEEAIAHVDRKIADYNVKIDLKDDLLMGRMDVRLIVQVIVNLLNNAIKYTPKGTDITLAAEKIGDKLSVTISDNGPGIRDEFKEHIFDMFYSAEIGRADDRRGLGLGLSLCKSILQAHGEDIILLDNFPHGAAFRFTLPLEEINV